MAHLIEEHMERAIQTFLTKMAEDAVAKAVANFDAEMRKGLAQVVMSVSSCYQVDRDRENLVITVKNLVDKDIRPG